MRKFKRLTMTLALLIMAVGGAWAQSSPNVVKLEVPTNWEGDNSNVTTADLPGFKAYSSLTDEEAKAIPNPDPNSQYVYLIYMLNEGKTKMVCYESGSVSTLGMNLSRDLIKKSSAMITFYYTAEPTEWDLTSKDGKNWILAEMPASNIELQVEYFAESNLFLSKEAQADKGSIAVKAGDLGVQFGEDGKSANTVTEGTPMTVKFNGTKKVLGLKVAKKAPTLLSIQIDGHVTATIYYFEGETWEQAIQNHPTENSAWKIQNGYISGNGVNLTAGDNYEKVNPNDTIDPKAKYHLMWT